MAIRTCIKCSGHAFDLASATPLVESRKLTLVQCLSCGTPIGALDPTVGPQVETLRREVAAIDDKLSHEDRTINLTRRFVAGIQPDEFAGRPEG
jgi:hypothetical protein